jgi:hypothetical protein
MFLVNVVLFAYVLGQTTSQYDANHLITNTHNDIKCHEINLTSLTRQSMVSLFKKNLLV